MTIRSMLIAVLSASALALPAAQSAAPVDTSKIGPPVGATLPAFAGVDQFGRNRTLASVYGPKGAMVVFFRSADW